MKGIFVGLLVLCAGCASVPRKDVPSQNVRCTEAEPVDGVKLFNAQGVLMKSILVCTEGPDDK